MKKFFLRLLLALLCLTGSASHGAANLEVTVVAERRVVIADQQTVRYLPASDMRLGEQIYYTLKVRNTGAQSIANAVIEQPIPRNTRYLGSAQGPAAEVSVSVDGGMSYGQLNNLTVATAPGATRRAVAADCTHLRWKLRYPLSPGATALLRFRAEFR